MKRAAIYPRVSTQDQTTANQEHELRRAAERANWQVVRVYKDHGISGAKDKSKRNGKLQASAPICQLLPPGPVVKFPYLLISPAKGLKFI
jgi:Resolvase, N terminal domain